MKGLDARLHQQLRQRPWIAEGVRQPGYARTHPEFALVKTIAVQQLPNQRFTTGHIAVLFHPGRATGFPAAFLYPALNPLPQVGIVLLHKHVQLRLAGGKMKLGILLHQPQHSRKRAAHLAFCLAQRPQPGRVYMGMANQGKRPVMHIGRKGFQALLQRPTRTQYGRQKGRAVLLSVHLPNGVKKQGEQAPPYRAGFR